MKDKIVLIIPIFGILALWVMVSSSGAVPEYVLPSVKEVFSVYVDDFKILFDSTATTVTESVLGLLLGVCFGFIIAVLMDRFKLVKHIVYPVLVVTQSVPLVALAPIIVLLLGYGMVPKIFLTAGCCFFPITVSLYTGFKSPDKQYFDLFKTMNASKFQIFRFVKLPFAMRHLASGLKIAATYSIISALLAEWVGGNVGLGVYMIRAKNSYAFNKLYADVILVCIVSIALVKVIGVICSMLLKNLNVSENRDV